MSVAILTDPPTPIGIPAVFLDDELAHGATPDDVLDSSVATLLHQYRGAKGFAFNWGHVIEDAVATARQRLLPAWRVVPVSLYETPAFSRATRIGPIPTLLREIRAELPPLLLPSLPSGLMVTGCHHQAFLHPHALLSLQLVDGKQGTIVRRWLDEVFIACIVPSLIELVLARTVTRAMQPNPRSRDLHAPRAH